MITLAALIMLIKIAKNIQKKEEQWMLPPTQENLVQHIKGAAIQGDTAGARCYNLVLTC